MTGRATFPAPRAGLQLQPRASVSCRRVVPCKSSAKVQDSTGDVSEAAIGLMDLPSKAGMPLMGMFGYLWKKNLDLSDLHAELGDTIAVNLGMPLGGWHLATCDPEVARDILDSNDDRFYAAWPDVVTLLAAPQGVRITDAQAKPWRRILSSALSPEVVMSLQLPLMVQDVTTQMRAIASAGEEVFWHTKARRIAFGVATRATMGTLVADDEVDDLCAMYDGIAVTGALNFGLPEGIPGTAFHKSMQRRKAIEAALYAKIKPAIDDPERFGSQRCAVLRMYQGLLDEQQAGAEAVSNAEIARKLTQDAFFLMFAGTDTTSYTLMKCALVLDRNPEWFQRLKDEQDQLRAEYGDAIDRKVLSRSNVASAMAIEVLRLNAPAAALFRRAARDTTTGGVSIPEGTNVLINIRKPTAETGTGTGEFDPSQWINADGTAAKSNDGKGNLAFGVGPRRCVGQSVAMVEVITTLAIMAREVDTLTVPPEEHDINFGPSAIHPTRMPIRFTARAPAAVKA